jgi:hypothetical protein
LTLRSGDQKRAKDYEENGPKLSIFGERDHGALLQIVGNRPIHIDPESCADAREGIGEALTGERIGQAIEP